MSYPPCSSRAGECLRMHWLHRHMLSVAEPNTAVRELLARHGRERTRITDDEAKPAPLCIDCGARCKPGDACCDPCHDAMMQQIGDWLLRESWGEP